MNLCLQWRSLEAVSLLLWCCLQQQVLVSLIYVCVVPGFPFGLCCAERRPATVHSLKIILQVIQLNFDNLF